MISQVNRKKSPQLKVNMRSYKPTFDKNLVNLLLVFICSAFLYLTIFSMGNFSAPDRINYYNFFSNSEDSRFEPGFVLFAQLTNFLNMNSEQSLLVVAGLIFLFAFLTITNYFSKAPVKVFIVLSFLLLAISSIYSFAQIRGALAIWSGLLIYNFYQRENKIAYIFLLTLTCSIHLLMIFFVGIVIAQRIFSMRFMLLAGSLGLFILYNFYAQIIETLGLNPYYLEYFEGSLVNNLFYSPFLLLYFFIMIFIMIFRKESIIKINPIIWLGLPPLFFAYLTGIDLIVKFAAPLMIYTWIVFFKLLFSIDRWSWFQPLVYIGLFSSLPLVIFYPFIKYVF